MKVYLIMFGVVATMGLGGYLYYKDTQATISTLEQNNAKLETSIVINEQTISNLDQANKQLQSIYEQVDADYQTIRRQNDVLVEKLERHDIGVLAAAKPVLVERIINNATDNVNRCFELLSGAELTDKERGAESANAFNSECPWLKPTP